MRNYPRVIFFRKGEKLDFEIERGVYDIDSIQLDSRRQAFWDAYPIEVSDDAILDMRGRVPVIQKRSGKRPVTHVTSVDHFMVENPCFRGAIYAGWMLFVRWEDVMSDAPPEDLLEMRRTTEDRRAGVRERLKKFPPAPRGMSKGQKVQMEKKALCTAYSVCSDVVLPEGVTYVTPDSVGLDDVEKGTYCLSLRVGPKKDFLYVRSGSDPTEMKGAIECALNLKKYGKNCSTVC